MSTRHVAKPPVLDFRQSFVTEVGDNSGAGWVVDDPSLGFAALEVGQRLYDYTNFCEEQEFIVVNGTGECKRFKVIACPTVAFDIEEM
jgi:hypothetical protein